MPQGYKTSKFIGMLKSTCLTSCSTKGFILFINCELFSITLHFILKQVNPHTHQLKLCDFGSAKALVGFLVSWNGYISFFSALVMSNELTGCLFKNFAGKRGIEHILHLF